MKKLILIYILVISECYAASLPEVPHKVVMCSYRIALKTSKVEDGITYNFSEEARASAVAIGKRKLLSAGHLMLLSQLYKDMTITYCIQIFDDDGVYTRTIEAKVTKWVLVKTGFDLLELDVDEDLPYYTKIDMCNTADVGGWVYTVGAKAGLSPFNINWGQLSSKKCELFPELYQTSIVVCGGNSGGPVYNAKNNKLLGIIVRGSELSFYVPLNKIDQFLKAKQEDLPASDVTPQNANEIKWPVMVKP